MNETLKLYHRLYDLRDDDKIYEGQEYVYQRYFYFRPNAITKNPEWDRRHIRKIGTTLTLCWSPCRTKYGGEWALEPRANAFLDVCPECRSMAEYYSRNKYPEPLTHQE